MKDSTSTTPQTAAARLKKVSPLRPKLAIVLGSGFHHVLAELKVTKKIAYAKIPGLPRFVDLTEAYDKQLRELLFQAGKSCKLKLQRGVYLAVSGPSYETPAEIRAFATLGADAVGMSTVPEAIAARQLGLNVAAVSCVTNLAAGISKDKLSHTEVLETAERVKKSGAALMKRFVELYGQR